MRTSSIATLVAAVMLTTIKEASLNLMRASWTKIVHLMLVAPVLMVLLGREKFLPDLDPVTLLAILEFTITLILRTLMS